MPLPEHYLYLRGLRQVDHTVFCVANGQKTYYDPVANRRVPYSSGQQVKHSILDELSALLDEPRASVTFNWRLKKDKEKVALEEGEVWSACDPNFTDQLLGGWMKAGKDASEGAPVKRRSPLSISAMRPLHPTLSGLSDEQGTFDRSNNPEQHRIRVTNEQGKELSKEEFMEILAPLNRTPVMRKFLPEDQMGSRATGLFIYDVAIDMRTLFSVALADYDPEITRSKANDLKQIGWNESTDGNRLVCPADRREAVIPALARSLIEWRVTSNQSRTFSPQLTLAVAISRNANRIGTAIRAELTDESEYKRAAPIVEEVLGAKVFATLPAKGYIREIVASDGALDAAETYLVEQLRAYDYDA